MQGEGILLGGRHMMVFKSCQTERFVHQSPITQVIALTNEILLTIKEDGGTFSSFPGCALCALGVI